MLHLLLFLQNSVCHTLAQEDSVAPASVSTELSLSHSGSGRQCCTCFCFYRTQFVTLWLRKTVLHLLNCFYTTQFVTLWLRNTVLHLLLFLQNSVCHNQAWEDSVAPVSVSTELGLSHSGSGRQCCTCFCFYRTQFVTLWLRKTVLHLLLSCHLYNTPSSPSACGNVCTNHHHKNVFHISTDFVSHCTVFHSTWSFNF